MVSSPKSVQAQTVSSSIQDREPLASGRTKPPSDSGTKERVSRSNSRVTSASEPPWESATRARR